MLQLFQRVNWSAIILGVGIIFLGIGSVQMFSSYDKEDQPIAISHSSKKELYQKDKIRVENIQTVSEVATSSANIKIKVDVSGAITSPGVYELENNARLDEALKVAGGLSKKADTAWVAKNLNLAVKLADGDKIFIPTREESKVFTPATEPAALQPQQQIAGISTTSQPGLQKAPTSEPTASTPAIISDKININTASESELDILPGVGPVTAQKIIANRPYTALEQLKEKKAVNKSTFEKIKEKITL